MHIPEILKRHSSLPSPKMHSDRTRIQAPIGRIEATNHSTSPLLPPNIVLPTRIPRNHLPPLVAAEVDNREERTG